MSGLVVASEVALPSLRAPAGVAGVPDVTIRFGSVPRSLDAPTSSGPTWEMSGDRFLLRIPGVARFALVGGREVTCEPEPGVDSDEVTIFLIGTVMGILLHQRGQIVLHASATAVNGKAVLFSGGSGAGKSTLAAALAQRGYACVADDLCAISTTDAGSPVVYSDGRQLKLWSHTIERLHLGDRIGKRVRRDLEKHYVEHDARAGDAFPLAAIYALREARPPHRPGIEASNLVETAELVRRNAYRPLLVRRMGQRERYFMAAATIARSVGVYFLTRRLDFDELPASAQQLEAHWSEIGLLADAS